MNVGFTSVTKPNISLDWLTFSPNKNLLETSVSWLNETISVVLDASKQVPEYFLLINLLNVICDFGQSLLQTQQVS